MLDNCRPMFKLCISGKVLERLLNDQIKDLLSSYYAGLFIDLSKAFDITDHYLSSILTSGSQ